MTERKDRAVVGILLLVFVFFIVLMIFASYTMSLFHQGQGDGGGISRFASKRKGSVAVVEVKGVIMEAKSTIELLQKAEEDKVTKAILVRINSPGGAVGPTQEIYDEIRRIEGEYKSSEGKSGKPVYASFGSVAASGGYYIGAATRKIFSNPGTITGSIGVIMEFVDLSELFKWLKMNPQKVKAGRYKDMGNPGRAMTAEERSMLGGMVEGVRQQFVKHIVAVRGQRIKGNIQEISQGQIFSGEQAMALGLVDELGGLYMAGRKIHKELGFEGEFGLKFIKKRKKTNFFEIIESLEEAITRLTDLESMKGIFSGKTPILMFK